MNSSLDNEDLWGYGKRLRFVRNAIQVAFPGVPACEIRLLDVGCGTASQLGLPLANDGYDYFGIDLHTDSIAEAQRLAGGRGNVKFACVSVDDLEEGPFDVVILSEVLEHVPTPRDLLERSLRKLAPNGIAIVTVPNGYGEFEWDSWLFGGLGLERAVAAIERRRRENGGEKAVESSTENFDDRHIQFFTLSRLYRMFDEAGIEIASEQGSTLMSGPFVGHTLARSSRFIEWNAKVPDSLPLSFSSGWFFALKQKEKKG